MKILVLLGCLAAISASTNKIDDGLTQDYVECLVTGQKIIEQLEIVKLKFQEKNYLSIL